MATDPITGARYPQESDSGDVALWVQRGVNDLSTQVVPRFATATARDNAYQAAITAGTLTAIPDGARCSVNGVPYRRIGGSWRVDRNRFIWRPVSVNNTISNGGANETGITSGVAALANFTLYEAGRVSLIAAFNIGPTAPNAGAALGYIKVDGANITNPTAVSRTNAVTVTAIAGVDLAAGSHTVALRVEALGGDCTWTGANLIIHEGIAE